MGHCLCSRRSHGPLFYTCAFCLCFHFNGQYSLLVFSIIIFKVRVRVRLV